jgi:hypothetical protein
VAGPKKDVEKKSKTEKGNTSMVLEHPEEEKKDKLYPVEDVGKDLQGWEKAALVQDNNWRAGKQVTLNEYETALAILRKRPMGGGISKG